MDCASVTAAIKKLLTYVHVALKVYKWGQTNVSSLC